MSKQITKEHREEIEAMDDETLSHNWKILSTKARVSKGEEKEYMTKVQNLIMEKIKEKK